VGTGTPQPTGLLTCVHASLPLFATHAGIRHYSVHSFCIHRVWRTNGFRSRDKTETGHRRPGLGQHGRDGYFPPQGMIGTVEIEFFGDPSTILSEYTK